MQAVIEYKGYGIEYVDHLYIYRIFPIKYISWYGTYAKTVEEAKKTIDKKQKAV